MALSSLVAEALSFAVSPLAALAMSSLAAYTVSSLAALAVLSLVLLLSCLTVINIIIMLIQVYNYDASDAMQSVRGLVICHHCLQSLSPSQCRHCFVSSSFAAWVSSLAPFFHMLP